RCCRPPRSSRSRAARRSAAGTSKRSRARPPWCWRTPRSRSSSRTGPGRLSSAPHTRPGSLRGEPVLRPPQDERLEVLHRGGENALPRLAAEPRDVRRDDHVVTLQQPAPRHELTHPRLGLRRAEHALLLRELLLAFQHV